MRYEIRDGKDIFPRHAMEMEYVAIECYGEGMKSSVIKDLPEYLRFRDQYIMLSRDGETAGYLRWFPVTPAFVKEVLKDPSALREMTGDDLSDLKIGEKRDVLIHSAAVLPDDASDAVIRGLSDVLVKKLSGINRTGRFIGNIVFPAVTVTEMKICGILGLEKISENGDALVCYAPGRNVIG